MGFYDWKGKAVSLNSFFLGGGGTSGFHFTFRNSELFGCAMQIIFKCLLKLFFKLDGGWGRRSKNPKWQS